MAFDEMASMLHTAAGEVFSSEQRLRKFGQEQFSPPKNSAVLSPFQTINQEKLNPSRVEALQSMFENKQYQATKRRQVPKIEVISNKDDDNYYEINEQTLPEKEFSPPYAKPTVSKQSSSPNRDNQRVQLQQPHDYVPAFPVSQPPSYPPAGSTNSSQTGGYYSSGSSLGANSSSYVSQRQSSLRRSPSCRNSLIGKQSASSRGASLADDEDDGFYDNLHVEEKRLSRGSELDNVSMSSHRLPPVSGKSTAVNSTSVSTSRLGQFLRKISTSKPPISAASLISLNRVTREVAPIRPAPLMKSNSLSHDPWKKHVVDSAQSSQPRADKRVGIGRRLKNSIFGSKKRLN